MKPKNYLIAFLLFNFSLHAGNEYSNTTADPKVNIEIVNIVTNGLLLPNNTLSFTSAEDLDIEFDVKISYTGNNPKITEKGVVNCYYYEPNSFDNEIAKHYNNGVNPLYLFKRENIKLASNTLGYSYTFRQKLRFKKSVAFNSGCSIVFRYRTAILPIDISNKLTYKIIGGTKTGKEPKKSATADIKLTNISYSDGSPIINNKIIAPDFEGDEIGTIDINLSFDFNCTYGSNLITYYPGLQISISDNVSVRSYLTEWITPIITNGKLTFNNLKIKSSDLSPSSYLKIRFKFQEKDINLNCAIVKGNNSKPILYNIISDNQTVISGQTIKSFNSESPYMNFTIPCKYRGCNGNSDYRYINTFKWQTRTKNSNWLDIPNATTKDYSPIKNFTENTYYRRLAFYNSEQYSISNTISVTIYNPSLENTICCNQVLPLANSQPEEITGNIPDLNNFNYQWQICKNPLMNFQEWTDIPITNQNYTHIFTEASGRFTTQTSFRRLIKNNSLVISTSNIVHISRGGRPIVSSSKLSNNGQFTKENIINIYPNPFTNNFSIEGSVNINSIKLYDSFGQTVNIEKYQKSNNLIEVDTSKLQSGIYLLKVDNTTFSKTLMKN
ncbi:MAG: T9SS type A sorting domain-containing protein [Flavobacterium circumlabens]|uniref:T9SS type A sorting domain-containing protein n=1 Tax=Flavobacterium circumlabens TaxID=2133765 RepID=UPI0032655236